MTDRSRIRRFLGGLFLLAATVSSPIRAQAASFQLRVVDEHGRPLSGAVSVLVGVPMAGQAPDAAIVMGSPAGFDLDPGRYRFLVGAPGRTLRQLSVALDHAEVTTREITLTELLPIEIHLQDELGRPLAEAEVESLALASVELRLSPIAERLAPQLGTVTSDSGRAVVWVARAGVGRYVVSKRGREAKVLEVGSSSGGSIFRVGPGGSYTVDVSPKDDLRECVFWLSEAGASPLAEPEMTRRWIRLWDREPLEWLLRFGAYELWVNHRERAAGRRLASFELSKVTPAASHLLVLERDDCWRPPRPQRPERSVFLDVAPDGLRELSFHAWSSGELRSVPPAGVEMVKGRTRLKLAQLGCSAERILAQGADWLALTWLTTEQACGDAPVQLRALAAARVRARFVLPAAPGDTAPLDGFLAGLCGDDGIEVPFLANENRDLEWLWPADCVLHTVWVDGFSPHRLPPKRAEGATLELGVLRLSAGATIRARLTNDVGEPRVGERVALVPGQPNELLRSTGRSDSNGWVVFRGVPNGEWRLELEKPGESVRRSAPLFVEFGGELVLDPVVLPRSAAIIVSVDPDFDRGLDPVAVYIEREGEGPNDGLQQDLEGLRARFEGLEPGLWNAMLIVSHRGKRFPSHGKKVVEVTAASTVEVVLGVDDRLGHGRVTSGGLAVGHAVVTLEPLEAANRSRRSTVKADENGEFAIPLEGPGVYRPKVFHRDFGEVTLDSRRWSDPDEELSLEVPATSIAGSVHDARGGVAAASVTATLLRDSLLPRVGLLRRTVRADPAGAFELFGLLPGRWALAAETSDAASEPIEVDLESGKHVDGVVLRLEEAAKREFRVVTGSGEPAAGLRCRLFIAASVGPPQVRTSSVGSDGTVSFLVGEDAREGSLACKGGSSLAFSRLVKLDDPGPAVVVARESHTVLKIDLGEEERLPNSLWLINQHGGFLSAEELGARSADGLTIGGLEPGRWRLVRVENLGTWHALTSLQGHVIPSLVEVLLEEGQTVSVSLVPE